MMAWQQRTIGIGRDTANTNCALIEKIADLVANDNGLRLRKTWRKRNARTKLEEADIGSDAVGESDTILEYIDT
jgi:hypothetical protein